jgi:hypothetical protein
VIISHEHRFIFIKTYKTAGTSIEIFLSRHCGERDVLTPINPHVEPHRPRNYRGLFNPFAAPFRAGELASDLRDLLRARRYYNHMSAARIRHRVPARVWSGYFKFCVERNPWDKTLSHYFMLRELAAGRGSDLTLDEYFRQGDFCLNYPLYTDGGRLIVDRVLRYEALDRELAEVMSDRGIPFQGALDVQAKSNYRQDRRSYRDVLEPRYAHIVERVFATEIALHGYAW